MAVKLTLVLIGSILLAGCAGYQVGTDTLYGATWASGSPRR